MGVLSAQVATNASTPVEVFPPATFTSNLTGAVADPIPALVQNIGATTIYIGGQNVTSGNGYPITANSQVGFQWVGTDMQGLFAVAASGTPSLAVLVGRQ